MSVSAQSNFKKIIDEDTKKTYYLGEVTFDDLKSEKLFTWYKPNKYEPNKDVISELSTALKYYDIKLVVLMGTWCSDSHNLIPKLNKVLTSCKYPLESMPIYALDYSKRGPNKEEIKYHVEYVPTIILTHENKEIGRIVESINERLEIDMLRIIIDYTSDKMDY